MSPAPCCHRATKPSQVLRHNLECVLALLSVQCSAHHNCLWEKNSSTSLEAAHCVCLCTCWLVSFKFSFALVLHEVKLRNVMLLVHVVISTFHVFPQITQQRQTFGCSTAAQWKTRQRTTSGTRSSTDTTQNTNSVPEVWSTITRLKN